ncbi:MAG: flagellar basal body-associated FliL family protein [Deltaproteobacteria bacterium]|jgi:flagellar FliL protein|nr:flagellar basal body-associated FliL family protein [Deltaproteobacteria bacterium]
MAQEDELPVKKKKGKGKFILLLLLLLLLGGGGGAAYYFGLLDKFLKHGDETGEEQRSAPQQKVPAALKTSTVSLPTFITNLYDPMGRRYIKLDLELELVSPEVSKELQTQNARIRDSVIVLLSSKSSNDISTEEGRRILKNELIDRINLVLGGPKVVQIFFTDLMIQ